MTTCWKRVQRVKPTYPVSWSITLYRKVLYLSSLHHDKIISARRPEAVSPVSGEKTSFQKKKMYNKKGVIFLLPSFRVISWSPEAPWNYYLLSQACHSLSLPSTACFLAEYLIFLITKMKRVYKSLVVWAN